MTTYGYLRDGTALGCIALCAHCKYAIQLRRDRWQDDETGAWHEADFWHHFVTNVFTAHTAAPCPDVGDGVGR